MTKIYCTFDKVSEEYSMPWFAKNDYVACRNIKIAASRENLPLSDIILLCIGAYDQEKGVIDHKNNPGIPIPLNDEPNLIQDTPME